VLYDLVRAARMLFKAGRLHLLIGDIFFFMFCGVLTSLFALPFNKGGVRAFIVFGEALGFLVYRLTIGRVAGRFYSILSKGITFILKKICELLKNFFDLLLKCTSFVVYNVTVLLDRFKRTASAAVRKKRSKKENCRKDGKKAPAKSGKRSKRGVTKQKKRNGYEKRYKEEKQRPRQ